MDNKTLTAVIITALVVALLTSLITVKLTGNVISTVPGTSGGGGGGGVSPSGTSIIADSASIAGINIDNQGIYMPNPPYATLRIGAYSGKSNNVNIGGGLILGDQKGASIDTVGSTSLYITSQAGVIIKNHSAEGYGTNFVVQGRARVTENLNVDKLRGTGNAYACLDLNGQLYRSSSACSMSDNIKYILNVAKTGTGKGDVKGTDIYCGSLCSAKYAPGKIVSLAAYSAVGSKFIGWSGACSGTSQNCNLTMNNNKFVTAQFSV